ncbi:hypothetical protein D046_9165, partial [Vibrio parahaemolyticus V-223/04]
MKSWLFWACVHFEVIPSRKSIMRGWFVCSG